MAERMVLVSIAKASWAFNGNAFGESGTSNKSSKEGVGLAVQVNV